MIDWQAIQAEYITTNISYRKLAQKYGVGSDVIGKRSRQEGWREARQRHQSQTMSSILEADTRRRTDLARQLGTTAGKLLHKVDEYVDNVRPRTDDPRQLRYLSATLKDVKDVLMIRSDLDEQEQHARIQKLQRQAKEETFEQTVLWVEGLPEEFQV